MFECIKAVPFDGEAIVGVVIPFFQRERGLLARAIASVRAQQLPPGVRLRVIVVDDGSPVPAREEIEAGTLGAVTVELVEQANQGVAAARNAALDRLDGACGYVALLDPDDWWDPTHIGQALACLAGGTQLYFANCRDMPTGERFDPMTSFLPEALGAAHACATLVEDGAAMSHRLAREYFPQTSFLVFERSVRTAELRFDRQQKVAGEDVLFAIALARLSLRVAVQRKPQGQVSAGVSLYRSTLGWNSEGIYRRLVDQLQLWSTVEHRFGDDAQLGAIARANRCGERDLFGYLVLRHGWRHPAQVGKAVWRVASAPSGGWRLVAAALANGLRRAFGQLLSSKKSV